jgi:thiol-disulfide isomerase/thioredoxin
MKPFVDAYLNEKDHEKAAEIRDKFDPYNEQKAKIDYEYFEKHPASYVTAYQLRYRVASLSADKLMYYYNRFTPELKQSAYGKELNDEIKMLKAGSPGSEATDFSTIDINNKPLKLSDFKGRYVLLDFWASWCVPCRKSFPHLLELSHKYNDLEILCISDDDSNPALWKAAVEKDGIGGWHHVLRGFDRKKLMLKEKNENDISTKFGIHTLPTKILIDPSGKIVGRYGGGENEDAIDKKLAEIFR